MMMRFALVLVVVWLDLLCGAVPEARAHDAALEERFRNEFPAAMDRVKARYLQLRLTQRMRGVAVERLHRQAEVTTRYYLSDDCFRYDRLKGEMVETSTTLTPEQTFAISTWRATDVATDGQFWLREARRLSQKTYPQAIRELRAGPGRLPFIPWCLLDSDLKELVFAPETTIDEVEWGERGPNGGVVVVTTTETYPERGFSMRSRLTLDASRQWIPLAIDRPFDQPAGRTLLNYVYDGEQEGVPLIKSAELLRMGVEPPTPLWEAEIISAEFGPTAREEFSLSRWGISEDVMSPRPRGVTSLWYLSMGGGLLLVIALTLWQSNRLQTA